MRGLLMHRRVIVTTACLVVSLLVFVGIRKGRHDKKRHKVTVVRELNSPVVCMKKNGIESCVWNRNGTRDAPQMEVSVAKVLHVPDDAPAVEKSLEVIAAERSQRMDDLLNQNPMPANYGQVMIDLFRAKALDIYTRDFAVQHRLAVRLAQACRRSVAERCHAQVGRTCAEEFWYNSRVPRMRQISHVAWQGNMVFSQPPP